jgi:hypothetical protein
MTGTDLSHVTRHTCVFKLYREEGIPLLFYMNFKCDKCDTCDKPVFMLVSAVTHPPDDV